MNGKCVGIHVELLLIQQKTYNVALGLIHSMKINMAFLLKIQCKYLPTSLDVLNLFLTCSLSHD